MEYLRRRASRARFATDHDDRNVPRSSGTATVSRVFSAKSDVEKIIGLCPFRPVAQAGVGHRAQPAVRWPFFEPTLTSPSHQPVLLNETLSLLSPAPGDVLLDCTAGLGGHSCAIAPELGTGGRVLLCDLDSQNLEAAAAAVRRSASGALVVTHHGSFVEGPRVLAKLGLKANLVLADLGFASNQVDDAERGLSFMRDGPLDMRLDATRGVTAAEIVMSAPEQELARIIFEFGEERMAKRVASAIVEARRQGPISTTGRLAEIVRAVVPRSRGADGTRGIDPATRTFQALRMATNDELGHLAGLLDAIGDGAAWLAPGARVAIITFHSLEDRPVKQAFGEMVRRGVAADLSRKPIVAQERETWENPRARSAKLRGIVMRGP